MSSARATVVAAMAALLADIKSGDTVTVAGSTYTYGSSPASVDQWRKTPYSASQLPAIGLWDMDQALEADAGASLSASTWRLTVVVVGWVKATAAAAQVRTMMDDIAAAVGASPTLAGAAISTRCVSAKMMLDDATADIVAGCELTFEVLYRAPLYTL